MKTAIVALLLMLLVIGIEAQNEDLAFWETQKLKAEINELETRNDDLAKELSDFKKNQGSKIEDLESLVGHCNPLNFGSDSWIKMSVDEQRQKARLYQLTYAKGKKVPVEKDFPLGEKGLKVRMVLIPPGSYQMGSPESDQMRQSNEEQHLHIVKKPFWISKYELTNEQWLTVMENNPSGEKGNDYPVENVSWNEATEFCRQTDFRLPREAEWEYACRGGVTTRYYWGKKMNGDYCWHSKNPGNKTQPIGEKKPNSFGLHDMSGNVWEHCDGEHGTKDENEKRYKVTRGGSVKVNYGEMYFRSAFRGSVKCHENHKDNLHLGFRLAKSFREEPAKDIYFTSFYGYPEEMSFHSRGGKFYFFISSTLLGNGSKEIPVQLNKRQVIGTLKGYTNYDYGILPPIIIGPIVLEEGVHSLKLDKSFSPKDVAQVCCLEVMNEYVNIHDAIKYDKTNINNNKGHFKNQKSKNLLFIASATGHSNNNIKNLGFNIKLGEQDIGRFETPVSKLNTHRAPAPVIYSHEVSLGEHNVEIRKHDGTNCDENDYSQLVVLEHDIEKIIPHGKIIPYSKGRYSQPLSRKGQFKSEGGTLVFFTSATASRGDKDVMEVKLYLNGNEIQKLETLNGTEGSLALVPSITVLKGISEGEHRVELKCVSGKTSENDVSQVFVLEVK